MSTSRTVTASSSGQGSLVWPVAQPDDDLDYSLDISSFMTGSGDSIIEVQWSVRPYGSGELVASNLRVAGGVIATDMAGGVAGRFYSIRVAVLSALGNSFTWFVQLEISGATETYPRTPPEHDDYGTPLAMTTPFTTRVFQTVNLLSEIESAGPSAQATARANLGVIASADALAIANSLSEIASAGTVAQATARTNIGALAIGNLFSEIAGLGSSSEATARTNIGAPAASAVLSISSLFSEIAGLGAGSQATARTNIGAPASTAVLAISNSLSEIANSGTVAQASARTNIGAISISNGVTVDPGVDPVGAYNQAAAVTRTTKAGAGAGPHLSAVALNYNTLFGYFVGNQLDVAGITTSTENTMVGYASGANQPSGNFNVYLGNGAGWGVNTANDSQTFIGTDCFRGAADHGFYNSGVNNTGLGFQVFRNGNFTRCVGLGMAALRLFNNTGSLATVSDVVAVGYNAMGGDNDGRVTVTGSLSFITAVGNQAGANIGLNNLVSTTGGTFMGFAAAGNLNSGRFSTLIGYESGLGKSDFTSVGNFITAVGALTAASITSGIADQLFGYNAGNALTTGLSNDFFGYTTAQLATSASYNSIYGSQSALQLTTGQQNTIVGNFCGATQLITGSNNILIGYSIDTVADDSNTINIGNAFLATSAGSTTAIPAITLAGTSVAFANALLSSTTLGPALDVPSQIVTAVAVSAAGTGYAPKDSVNGPNGGRYNISATQVVTATVAVGGTGGTPGTQTFFGTTGLGGKWQGSGTVDGTGALTGTITIVGAGNYSFNPTIAGDTVSGGGLVGAKVALTMGAKTLTIAKAGVTASPPSNPVSVTAGARQILTTESGTGLTLTLTWSARQALQLNQSGNDVFVSSGSLATSAVIGFLGLPACAGTPTGAPTNASTAPLLAYNSSSNTLNIYSGGAWHHVALSSGAG